MIDHLRMKMDKCIFHHIVYHYLESLYKPWWRFELPNRNAFASHYCFSGINSFDHNKALSLFHEHGPFSKRMYHINEPARHIEFTHSYNYPSPVSRAKYKPNPSLQQSPEKKQHISKKKLKWTTPKQVLKEKDSLHTKSDVTKSKSNRTLSTSSKSSQERIPRNSDKKTTPTNISTSNIASATTSKHDKDGDVIMSSQEEVKQLDNDSVEEYIYMTICKLIC